MRKVQKPGIRDVWKSSVREGVHESVTVLLQKFGLKGNRNLNLERCRNLYPDVHVHIFDRFRRFRILV